MKRAILLFALIIPMVAFAQDHLEFRGVPINGDIDKFTIEMKKLGYSEVYRQETGVVMKGKFTNKDATLYVLATAKTKTVWKVTAQIDGEESWSKLKSKYFDYVNLYISKYGQPSDHFEFFSTPYFEGDGYELQALRKDKCYYSSFFTIEKGELIVNISSSGKICLSYEDGLNTEIMKAERRSSALDDI